MSKTIKELVKSSSKIIKKLVSKGITQKDPSDKRSVINGTWFCPVCGLMYEPDCVSYGDDWVECPYCDEKEKLEFINV